MSVLILDFGSQYTQLIARNIRALGYYSEIKAFNYPIEDIKADGYEAIILSGGPNSVFEEGSPQRDVKELEAIAPVLGICYGMQLIQQQHGGEVSSGEVQEYGKNKIFFKEPLADFPEELGVWMSHGDSVSKVAPGFKTIAVSDEGHPAILQSDRSLCFQLHPEVAHTDQGQDLLKYFLKDFSKMKATWSPKNYLDRITSDIKKLNIKEEETILCALSGGVDSTVTAVLLSKIFGKERVQCVFVDNGLLRKNEYEEVTEAYKELDLNVHPVNATDEFLTALAGESDPEKKRKIIGRTFIEVFKGTLDSHFKKFNMKWLAQGTLYPDLIESVSVNGANVTIKSHHNVGGLPKELGFSLVEPLKFFFKDEVRLLGEELGIDPKFLYRHPFPGPGLAIRILGEITEERLEILKNADKVYIDELKLSGDYDKIWQAFCVLLPVKTVGVQGDRRTYDNVVVLRAVTSSDGMTADWYEFDYKFLKQLSNKITNRVRGVNRVVYDVSSKPPGTIEWE